MSDHKDSEFEKMKRNLQEQIDKDRRSHTDKVKDLVTEFKQDM